MCVPGTCHPDPPALPLFFFFNDTATTEIYTLSLHDALPIYLSGAILPTNRAAGYLVHGHGAQDRKSTRLNSSHMSISYAVFCLKKKTHRNSRPGFFTRTTVCVHCPRTVAVY